MFVPTVETAINGKLNTRKLNAENLTQENSTHENHYKKLNTENLTQFKLLNRCIIYTSGQKNENFQFNTSLELTNIIA